MNIHITDQEVANYGAFVKAQLDQLLQPAPTVLWHYTSGEALIC